MDEVLFRSSRKIENLQVQLNLTASRSKELLQEYSSASKSVILQAWNSPYSAHVKDNFKELWQYIISLGYGFQERVLLYVDPQHIYRTLTKVFLRKWTKRDIYFLSAGFICGTIVGAIITINLRKKQSFIHYMQAIQCTNYLGIESAAVVENVVAPPECSDNDVMVDVKAASVQVIDARICSGYGRTLSRIMRSIYSKRTKSELPVILGRDCTGIVTDAGQNVKRLEIGDEVWLTLPFWSDGALSQTVLIDERRVGKKPKNVGFEGACSLPYAGSLALEALKNANINQQNASSKRVLVHGGCTPVGCVLIQVLAHWDSNIIATCYRRAVPVAKALGASDVIVSPEPPTINDKSLFDRPQEELSVFQKELELKGRFDVVIVTTESGLNEEQLSQFCKPTEGVIVSTLPAKCRSDSYGLLGAAVVGTYIRFKYLIEKLFGLTLNDYDEAHLCYVTLDEIAEMVEDGYLQTVVDKVFQPQNIEIALSHIQSHEAIGSTVITFRGLSYEHKAK